MGYLLLLDIFYIPIGRPFIPCSDSKQDTSSDPSVDDGRYWKLVYDKIYLFITYIEVW